MTPGLITISSSAGELVPIQNHKHAYQCAKMSSIATNCTMRNAFAAASFSNFFARRVRRSSFASFASFSDVVHAPRSMPATSASRRTSCSYGIEATRSGANHVLR